MGKYASSAGPIPAVPRPAATGCQTLLRGLNVVEAVAGGAVTLAQLAQALSLTRSTVHRLASALVEREYLSVTRHSGYGLGPKLLELGFVAQRKVDLVQLARPYMEALAATTEDTVHLAVLDRDTVLYLDKITGRRRVNLSSQVGERQPLTTTGLGKALMLDHPPSYWAQRYAAEHSAGSPAGNLASWRKRMKHYVAAGHACDLEENEDQIRCVAAPVREAGGHIVGAVSVASAAQYMDRARMEALSTDVRTAAAAIGRELGWPGRSTPAAAQRPSPLTRRRG